MGHDEVNGLVLKQMNEDRGEMVEILVMLEIKNHGVFRTERGC